MSVLFELEYRELCLSRGSSVRGTPNSLTRSEKGVQHRYVQEMVRRYSGRAGIAKRITPHTLRHSFATDLYRETANIRLVQKALGHADLSTTMIYTHVYDEEIMAAMSNLRSEHSQKYCPQENSGHAASYLGSAPLNLRAACPTTSFT